MDRLAFRLQLAFAAIGHLVLCMMRRPQLAPIVVKTKE